MLVLALVVPAALAVVAALSFARLEVMAATFALGAGANVGRQAFDSLLQHHAPDADRGRAFARFETRFQLAWVLGAMGPVVVLPPPWLGMLALAAILVVGAGALLTGLRAARRLTPDEPTHVRDLLTVTDEAPVAVHLLLTAEGLAGEGFHDQAILVAGAAADACPGGATADARHQLDDLRRRAVHDGAGLDVTDADIAIALAAHAIARARLGR
jgi:MFS family permease